MQESTKSPGWKNPRDRIVKHARKKSNRLLLLPRQDENVFDQLNTESCPPIDLLSKSGANPFKLISPQMKRVKTEDDEPLKELVLDWDDSTANDSFSVVVSSKLQQGNPLKGISRAKSLQFGDCSFEFSEASLSSDILSTVSQPTDEKNSTCMPNDFRLGTKLRITSLVPFPWIKGVKSTGNVLVRLTGEERSNGLQFFMDYPEDTSSLAVPNTPSSSTSLVEAASLYWQYPALPWLNLYPRIDTLLKNIPKQSAPPLAPSMIDVINKQWKVQQFRTIVYFLEKGKKKVILCSLSLVHEIDEGSVSCFQQINGEKHVAIVSPTNLGFRQYLKGEGIIFELCSYKRRRLSRLKTDDINETNSSGFDFCRSDESPKVLSDQISFCEKEKPDKVNNVEEIKACEEESPAKGTTNVQEWLEDIGVSPRNQLKLKRHKSMISTITTLQSGSSSKKTTEKDITSAEGASLQSLFNLLQNSKTTRSIAGIHANLPPTLIASKPFLYSQLLSLNKTSQVIKRQGQVTQYVLELEGGPIMPHSMELAIKFIDAAKLAVTGEAVVRVNDKTAYSGLNGVDQTCEWHDLKIKTGKFTWIPR